MSYMKIKNINKFYPIGKNDKFQALKNVSLDFDRGELVAIIGESGSGKSTMMNVIGGLDSDFTGELIVGDKKVHAFSEKELVEYHKSSVGFVFQSFNLISHLSVLDNVTLAMTLSNVDKKTRTARALEILEQVGLADQVSKKPNQLSGGQKQRVAIARALINNPDVIIADEPTGALDSETAESIIELIQAIAKSGKLVIVVTHSERVAASCSRVVEISDGVIIGDKVQTKNEAKFEERVAEYKNKNLSFFSAVRLALLNMKEKFGRNVLVALGGSIGITSVIIMLSLGSGINRYLTDTMGTQVNPLVAEARIKNERGPSGPMGGVAEGGNIMEGLMDVDYIDEADITKLANIDNVESIQRGYNGFGLGYFFIQEGDSQTPFMMIETVSPLITESDIYKGRVPVGDEIMLSKSLYEGFEEDVLNKKITLSLLVDNKMISYEATVVGVYGSDDASSGMSSMLTSVFVDYDYLIGKAEEKDVEIGATVVYLVAENEKFTKDIKADVDKLGFAGSTSDTMLDMFTQMLDVFTYVLTGVSAISLVVSAIMILTVLFISVVERTNEIGVLKAIGARKKDIRRIFVSESFLIGLFSGLVGIALAYLISLGVNSFSLTAFNTAVLNVRWEYLVAGLVISVVISMISGVIPANRAAKLDPVESLRHD